VTGMRARPEAVSRGRAEALFERRLQELAAQRPAGGFMLATVGSGEAVRQVGGPVHQRDIHPFHEFTLVTRGRARVAVPNGLFELRPGRLLLIERNVEHYESASEPPLAYDMFWCHVQGSAARLYRTRHQPPRTWRRRPSLELLGRTDVENIVAAIAAELSRRDWGWLGAVQGLLTPHPPAASGTGPAAGAQRVADDVGRSPGLADHPGRARLLRGQFQAAAAPCGGGKRGGL